MPILHRPVLWVALKESSLWCQKNLFQLVTPLGSTSTILDKLSQLQFPFSVIGIMSTVPKSQGNILSFSYVPLIEMISVFKLPSVSSCSMVEGPPSSLIKLEHLRTLGPNGEVERISLVRVLTSYLTKLKEVNESTQFTILENSRAVMLTQDWPKPKHIT